MTLGEMLERSAERYPDKIAIVYKDQQLLYKDLNAQANQLGRALNDLGVGRNDKVGLLMPNCPEAIVGVFGILKAGGVFVGLNPVLQGRELTYVINHSDAKAIIAAPPYDELLAMLRPQLPQVQHLITLDDDPEEDGLKPLLSLIEPYAPSNLKPKVQLHEMAAIYYTSGTTGLPKGAMLSHVNILSSTVAIGKAVNASRKDVPLNCLPLFHTLAMTACIMVPIFGGMTNILLDTFLPQPVLQGFNDWKVTIFVGVPTMFAVLGNMPNLDRYDVSHLKLCYCGGAPLTTAVAERFESKFPGKIYEGYGLSECSPLVSVNPLGNRKIGSIGKPADRVEWKLVDKNRQEVPVGEVGEIAVKGPNVMMGYYKDEEATNECIQDGWFYTGDLAYMDEDGFVFIADRKKDMIIVGGENVYPKEVEDVLTQHPAVQDAGVIGVEDPIRGEVPKAYIVPAMGAEVDEKDILEYCREHLAQFKLPRSIEAIDEIPKNVTGKILKRVLRRIAAGLPPDEEDEDFDEDFEDEEDDEEELESAGEAIESVPTPPSGGGMSLEEQMRAMEGGGTPPPPPPAGGMSLEEQMRAMEGGGTPPPPPPTGGMSMEEQMRAMESGGETPPQPSQTAPPEQTDQYDTEPVGFEELLRQLVMDTPGGIAGSIAGLDGIGIASFSSDPDFATAVADAELAAIMGTVKKAAESLMAGNPKEAYFVADRYGFVLKLVGAQYLVMLVVEASELNWGLTRLHLNKLTPLIERELL